MPLVELVQCRYGLLFNSFDTDQNPVHRVFDVLKYILESAADIGELGGHHTAQITLFFGALLKGTLVPDGLWDLQDSSHSLRNKFATGKIAFKRTQLNGADFFELRSSSVTYRLLLQDSISVLQCVREQLGPDSYLVAKYLAERGIPFLKYPMTEQLSLIQDDPSCLDFACMDFGDYETKIRTFFNNPARCSAAICKGGIVGRLVKEYASNWKEDLRCTEDVRLSGALLDRICGVYKSPTGQGSQTSDCSWWPKLSMWEGSNCDVGYWAIDNEAWFTARLTKLRLGEGRPLTAKLWRNTLKRHRATSRIVQRYREAADQFLRNDIVD